MFFEHCHLTYKLVDPSSWNLDVFAKLNAISSCQGVAESVLLRRGSLVAVELGVALFE